MNFNWWTFVLQTANFLILVWLLQHFLFKPVKAMVARRREEISLALNEASAERENSGRLKQEMQTQRFQMEAERQRLLEEQSLELSAQRQQILEQARVEAEKLKSQALAQLREERAAAMEELFQESVQLATALGERLLRELALPSLDQPFFARVLQYLDRLSATERSNLLAELGSGPLILTTAHPIRIEEQTQWRELLAKRIGANDIRFGADPALVAGAKLEFAHSILSFNWRDALDAAKKELLGPHERLS
jgi:F-type H+-transporting ATPase subunit b